MGKQRQIGTRLSDRRNRPDRRETVERRRGSDARRVAFEVCRSNLHMAIVVRGSGDEPAKVITRTIRWRNEATTLYSDVGVKELTDAFRIMVADERLAGVTTRIALSGEFCVTRVVSGATEAVRRECAELEERSHRYLTLGPGQKVLASCVQQLDARHEHALLTVANERTVYALMDIAETVALQIETIEPSLVALCRAQALLRDGCQDACLIIQLDDNGAEIGACHHGRLLLDYRPGGHTNANNVAEILAQHLTRLQRYLDRNHSYLTAPVRQIYLAGDTAAVIEACQAFQKFPQFDVTVLNPSHLNANWEQLGDAPGPDVAAALGASITDERPDADQRGPNLMERILAESREPIRPIVLRSLVPIAALLLIACVLFVLFQCERIATNLLRDELALLEPVRSRARELQLKLTAVESRLTHLAALERGLPRTNLGLLLSQIAQSLPDDVWLDAVRFSDSRHATIQGSSYADGGVYDFTNYLKQVPNVGEIALQGTGMSQSPRGPTTSFDLLLTLAPASDLTDQESRHD